MAVFQHFSHITIFTWLLVEGIHLYVKPVKVFSVQKLYIAYVIIGWGNRVILRDLSEISRGEGVEILNLGSEMR